MFELISQFRAFFRLATERKLTGSDQLMYLHLLNFFNEARRPESLRIKDAKLKESMRLFDVEGRPASDEVLRRGRQRLKARGFIEFNSKGGLEPEYRLPPLYPATPPVGTPAGTPATSSSVSHTLTVKEFKENRDRDDASACEADVAEATKPQVSNTPAKPLSTPKNGEDIHEVWQRTFGFELRGDQALTLEQLAAKDYARVEFAIRRTKEMEAKRPFDYFKTVYNDCDFKVQEPKTPPQTSDAFSADNLAEIRRQMELAGIPYPAK